MLPEMLGMHHADLLDDDSLLLLELLIICVFMHGWGLRRSDSLEKPDPWSSNDGDRPSRSKNCHTPPPAPPCPPLSLWKSSKYVSNLFLLFTRMSATGLVLLGLATKTLGGRKVGGD